MFILYQILIHFYQIGISLYANLGNLRAKDLTLKRKECSFLSISHKKNDLKRIWMHAASAGELLQLLPLAEKLKADNIELIFSAYSPSTLPFLKKEKYKYFILPADTFKISKELIGHIKPDVFITTGKEFWPNITIQLNKLSVPYILMNAYVPETTDILRSIWWRIYAPYISIACCVDEFSSSFLLKSGTKKVIVTGNTKADGVISNDKKTDERIAKYFSDNNLVVLGSGHQIELEYTSRFLNENHAQFPDWKWIIVPHHTDPDNYPAFVKSLQYEVKGISEQDISQDTSILFINETGLLAPLYAISSIAIIGGAWNSGLHNILEPASHHNAIIFGPKYHEILEANEMIRQNLAISVENYSSFSDKLFSLLENEYLRNQYANKAKTYFDTQKGASDTCYLEIKMLLN